MTEEINQNDLVASEIAANPELIKPVIEDLYDASRTKRQRASEIVSNVAHANIDILIPHISDLTDALNRPEAKTRWGVLDALNLMVSAESRQCDKALVGAESSLFDEKNGPVRLAAFRFLCSLGATTPARSEKIWPLLSDAISCYHGDFEYTEMLAIFSVFADGKIADSVKADIVKTLSFDAKNAKGSIGKRTKSIVDKLS